MIFDFLLYTSKDRGRLGDADSSFGSTTHHRSELAADAHTANIDKPALTKGATTERRVSISQGMPPLGDFLMRFRLVPLVYKTDGAWA